MMECKLKYGDKKIWMIVKVKQLLKSNININKKSISINKHRVFLSKTKY